MRPFLALALALSLPLPLHAQTWTVGSIDNGAWFEAHAALPGGVAGIHCGGVSPQGFPLPASDEPMLTAPYTMALSLRMPGVADFSLDATEARGDIAIVVGSTGYRLSVAWWDMINGSGWQADLPVGDPLLLALRGAGAFAVDTATGRQGVFSADGAAAALDGALGFCDARWAATGHTPPPVAVPWVNAVRAAGLSVAPAAAPSFVPTNLAAKIEAEVTRGCGGPFRREPDWLRPGELDGDGQPDYVLDWRGVECLQGNRWPSCGASQCSMEVFLSSEASRGSSPASFLGFAITILPGSAGRGLLRLAAPGNCATYVGAVSCDADFQWDGARWQRIR